MRHFSIESYVYTITGQIQNSESCLCIHALSWSYILLIIKQPIILLVCFAFKKHNPHTGGTNYQHPLHSTPFENKNPVKIYPFTVKSSWSIYKPLAAMLEQEEYGNIGSSSWEPTLAFGFPLVQPFLGTSKQQGPRSTGKVCAGALSSCTLRTQTDGTAAEMSERSWIVLLLCITLCSLPSEVNRSEALGKDVPSTANKTITVWKKSTGCSQQCFLKCISIC